MLLTYFWENWRYSNAPEGQRPFEKVIGLSKFGFAAGVGIGIYDTILVSQTAGFWNTVNCMSYWVVPITAMCATFASVAYTSTRIREKDDYFNYILASMATGGVFYHWQKNGSYAYSMTVALIGLSMVKKYGDMIGWVPIPLDPSSITMQYTTFPWDLTLVKDPRGPRPWEH